MTPALAAANNGNWQTARRWAQMLRGHYRVRVVGQWSGTDAADCADDLMIALHARRSAPSLAAWHECWHGRWHGRWHGHHPGSARHGLPARPAVLVLTGTDLYRDIAHDALAQRSLQLAQRLVVLNELGVQSLPVEHRSKALVCLQSTPARLPVAKTGRHLRALMVGHLREEKSPQTYFAAARLLAGRSDIRLDHIGSALDPALAAEARALMATHPHYRWLGGLPHAATRARIQAAHVLVHCSRMEGGAHVLTEAITSGTPVLASRIDGNLGLLGAAYAGTFDWGDAAALAALLQRCRDDSAMLARLQQQCQQRAHLFHPQREKQTLLDMLASLQSKPAA